ncbi:MAG: hypothetical protein OQJ89_10310, partial [Kangiellaceae bacterium]|nr:hypothetical protein [Kangiellaceae bacterium]
HLGFATQLGLSIQPDLQPIFEILDEQCQAVFNEKTISPSRHASIVACGELLSTTIGAHYLSKAGVDTNWVDARGILSSHNNLDLWHHFTSAKCDFSSDPKISQHLARLSGAIVTQGFIASDEDGATVLLGREGSDTSASYIGAKLQAQEIQIWTDVTGVFSSNPREIDGTIPLAELSYSQANLMARLGAKVLHPRAVEPAQQSNIPIRVKSTGNPHHPGTCISSSSNNSDGFGLVFEPRLTSIKFPRRINLEAIEKCLQSEGYDKVIEFDDTQLNQPESFWLYSNSDKPELTPQQLEIKLHDNSIDSLEISNNLALISLIGSQSIVEKIDDSGILSDISPIKLFRHNINGVIYIVVDSEKCLTTAQLLHDDVVSNL